MLVNLSPKNTWAQRSRCCPTLIEQTLKFFDNRGCLAAQVKVKVKKVLFYLKLRKGQMQQHKKNVGWGMIEGVLADYCL